MLFHQIWTILSYEYVEFLILTKQKWPKKVLETYWVNLKSLKLKYASSYFIWTQSTLAMYFYSNPNVPDPYLTRLHKLTILLSGNQGKGKEKEGQWFIYHWATMYVKSLWFGSNLLSNRSGVCIGMQLKSFQL